MAIDFTSKQFIGCIPLSAMPDHPTDQSPCEVWNCPTCGEAMWVSQRKRDHHARNPNTVEIHCLTCLAKEAYKQGIEIELQDIAKAN